MILAPERVLAPDDIAVEILQLCDSQRSVAQMIDQLAAKYVAPRDAIGADVIAMEGAVARATALCRENPDAFMVAMNPQALAVLTINNTCPSNCFKDTSRPSSVRAEKSKAVVMPN